MHDLALPIEQSKMSPPRLLVVRCVVIALGCLGVFLLPWYLPPSQPTDSLSYVYGFNNQVAWAAALITIAALSLLEILRRRNAPPNAVAACLSELLTLTSEKKRNTLLGKTALLVGALFFATAVSWYIILPYADYGEMSYFTSRLELMVLGHQPYSAFDFLYGPLLIYPQFWLYRIASGALSVEQAYGIAFTIHFVGGLFLLYLAFRKIGGKADLTLPFLCICGTFFIAIFAVGLNYTLVRFIGPPLAIFYLHALGSHKTVLRRCVFSCGLTFLNLLVSPEMGIAAFLSIITYFALRKDIYPIGAAILGLIAVIQLFGYNYFEGLISIGEGGANFPIFPTAHVILYLALLGLLLPQLAANEWYERGAQQGVAGALFVLCATTLPASLGRCDAGHILFNSLGLFILAAAVLANWPSLRIRCLSYSYYAAAFILVAVFCFWGHYHELIIAALKNRLTVIKQGDAYRHQPGVIQLNHPQLVLSKPAPRFWSDLEALKKYPSLGTPVSCEMEIDHFLKLSERYTPAYRVNPIEIFDRKGLKKQITAIRKMPHLLIPESYAPDLVEPLDEKKYNAANSRFLTKLFFFPVSFSKWRHPPFLGQRELVSYIFEHFEEQERWRHYIVMTQKDPDGGEASTD